MKKQLCLFSFLLASFGASASLPPFTGLYDVAISKGTGVHKIQFVLGGEGEQITGTTDTAAVRKLFRANVISLYHCYSASYGTESKTTGQMTVRFQLTAKGPSELSIDSTGVNSPAFTDCVKSAWNKLKFDSFPTDSKAVAVVMPVRAQLRH